MRTYSPGEKWGVTRSEKVRSEEKRLVRRYEVKKNATMTSEGEHGEKVKSEGE